MRVLFLLTLERNVVRLLTLTASCALSAAVFAGTLTIKDDDGTSTVTLQSTDYLVLQSYGNGNMQLTASGFTLSAGESNGGGDGAGGSASSDSYCSGADAALVTCDPKINFDPWIASTGERPYWIYNKKTKSFPFTTATAADSDYGFLQVTTFERNRDKYTEDIFHLWFSETPNGPPIEGVKCEYYATQARLNLYWSQREQYKNQVCFLGTEKRVLYVNAETRCSPRHYQGKCDDDNKQKSGESYNFDVSRRAY